MPYYSLVVVSRDELYKVSKDKDIGIKLEAAILNFPTCGGNGSVVVQNSTSAMRVISSFNADISPRVIITEGWHCYDLDKQTLPKYLEKYLKKKVQMLPAS